MAFTIMITADGFSISAATASEAVRKGKALFALGRPVTISGPGGEPIDLHMLELALQGKKLA